MVGSAQPDIGLTLLVDEIKSREIAISLDYISRLGRLAPFLLLYAIRTSPLALATFIGVTRATCTDPRMHLYTDQHVETNDQPAARQTDRNARWALLQVSRSVGRESVSAARLLL